METFNTLIPVPPGWSSRVEDSNATEVPVNAERGPAPIAEALEGPVDIGVTPTCPVSTSTVKRAVAMGGADPRFPDPPGAIAAEETVVPFPLHPERIDIRMSGNIDKSAAAGLKLRNVPMCSPFPGIS